MGQIEGREKDVQERDNERNEPVRGRTGSQGRSGSKGVVRGSEKKL